MPHAIYVAKFVLRWVYVGVRDLILVSGISINSGAGIISLQLKTEKSLAGVPTPSHSLRQAEVQLPSAGDSHEL